MDRLLTVVALTVVFLGEIEAWSQPNFCHNQPCPEYRVIDQNKDFEERRYVDSEWITTKVDGDSSTAFLKASSVLSSYVTQENKNGYAVSDTWPMLTFKEKTDNGDQYFLFWFVAPGTQFHGQDDRVETRSFAGTTVFVRSFSGLPTAQRANDNAQQLMRDLEKAGKRFDPNYYVAFYESFLSFTHYIEIWVLSI